MLQEFIIALFLAVIALEMIEHVFLPIFWFLLKGRKRSEYSHGGMKGKIVVIKCWKDKTGIVLFHAERWHAVSDYLLLPGEKAIVEEVSGLTLKIKPSMDTADSAVCLDRVK
jgi:membrane-bound ClpP family serine protease